MVTYYIAITSQLATPQILSDNSPLTRLEPVDSGKRIVEEHVNTGPDSYVPAQRLDLTPDDYHLGDVTLYVNIGGDLFTVDPFTGAAETDVTDYDSNINDDLPGAGSSFYYTDIDMRSDGRLYSITAGPNGGGPGGNNASANVRRLDTGNARSTGGTYSSQSTGIDVYEIDLPDSPTALRQDNNNGRKAYGGRDFFYIKSSRSIIIKVS